LSLPDLQFSLQAIAYVLQEFTDDACRANAVKSYNWWTMAGGY